MNEQVLREKTRDIYEAYTELTGMTPPLTIQDFILLRGQALSEGAGAASLRMPTEAPQAVQAPSGRARVKEASSQTEKPARPPQSTPQERPKPAARPVEVSVPQEEPPMSDFERLRAIKDPWN